MINRIRISAKYNYNYLGLLYTFLIGEKYAKDNEGFALQTHRVYESSLRDDSYTLTIMSNSEEDKNDNLKISKD